MRLEGMVAIHVYKDMGRVPSIACDGRNRVGRSSLGCGETDGGSQIRVRDVCVTPPLSLG
jgi:hypothetical protein